MDFLLAIEDILDDDLDIRISKFGKVYTVYKIRVTRWCRNESFSIEVAGTNLKDAFRQLSCGGGLEQLFVSLEKINRLATLLF